ncbi:response regulator [Vibrio brasiliensis]|uniref:response regulator n=1 Tax=Vibrio brasiliensis TaxID=170652 RepID=UPI001EFEC0AD|nr:response regulator [Vibrio brasiliensis]
MKILIVDDSKATLEIVRRGLESFGYCRLSIKKTCDAREAITIAQEWHPEIVLTDWYMPEMTGLTLIEELMKLGDEIKIGMITTVDDQLQIKQAKQAGASFVLSKPFEDAELHRLLLPLVQGAQESQKTLDSIGEVQKELALPKLTQLEKLLQRELGDKLTLTNLAPQPFDDSKIPCLLAVYEDSATQRPRAVAMLDLQAICVLSHTARTVSSDDIAQAQQSQLVGKAMLDACHKVLSLSALAFLDSQTRKSLRLKNVSFIAEEFDKLKTLYGKEADKRVDFSCKFGEMAEGKVTLVGF